MYRVFAVRLTLTLPPLARRKQPEVVSCLISCLLHGGTAFLHRAHEPQIVDPT